MAEFAVKRIQRELRDIIRSETNVQCGIKAELIEDNFFELEAEITGPPDTPYEGGKFKLNIKIPSNYPFEPPRVFFLTKVWHPNIFFETGIVCLDILTERWSPSLCLRTILLSIQVLLSAPNADHPLDPGAGIQYRGNPEMYELTARHWTNAYAGGPSKIEKFDDQIRNMVELGFCEMESREILSSCNWDLEYAIKNNKPCCVCRQ